MLVEFNQNSQFNLKLIHFQSIRMIVVSYKCLLQQLLIYVRYKKVEIRMWIMCPSIKFDFWSMKFLFESMPKVCFGETKTCRKRMSQLFALRKNNKRISLCLFTPFFFISVNIILNQLFLTCETCTGNVLYTNRSRFLLGASLFLPSLCNVFFQLSLQSKTIHLFQSLFFISYISLTM